MNDILLTILHVVLTALAPIVLAYAVRALQALHKRAGVQLDAAQLEAMQNLARLAVAGTEEWAANLLKVHGTAPGGADKLARAVAIVAAKFPAAAQVDLEHLVHAEVAALPNVGATGAVVVRSGDTAPVPAVSP